MMLVRVVANDLTQTDMVRASNNFRNASKKAPCFILLSTIFSSSRAGCQQIKTSNLDPEEGEIERRNLHDASPGMSGSVAAQTDRPVCDGDTLFAVPGLGLQVIAGESITTWDRVMVATVSQSSCPLQAVLYD